MYIGRPNKHHCLGRGGFGEVWRATYANRPVAVKYLIENTPDKSTDFRREVEILECLADVPYVVRIFASDLEATPPYYVMELCAGTLAKMKGKLAKEQQYDLLWHLVHAYKELRLRGIRHRDIKPPNILLRFNDRGFIPVFSDFGIARTLHTGRSEHGSGTPVYTDPLVLAGAPHTESSDIYSIGVTMFEVITGSPDPRQAALGVPGNMLSLLRSMTASDVRLRPSFEAVQAAAHESINMRNSPVWNALEKATGGEVLLALGAGAILAGALWPSKS
jgi:serine/threonine protein kinase